MMNQRDIDTAEHESGLRTLGEYPSHCLRCAIAAKTIALQSRCDHDSVSEIRTHNGGVAARYCVECGLRL